MQGQNSDDSQASQSEIYAALSEKARKAEENVKNLMDVEIPRLMKLSDIAYECSNDLKVLRTETFDRFSLAGAVVTLNFKENVGKDQLQNYLQHNFCKLFLREKGAVEAVFLSKTERGIANVWKCCTLKDFTAALKECMKGRDYSVFVENCNTPETLVNFVLPSVKETFDLSFKTSSFYIMQPLYDKTLNKIVYSRFVGKDLYAPPKSATSGDGAESKSRRRCRATREDEEVRAQSTELVSQLRALPASKACALQGEDQWKVYTQLLENPSPPMLLGVRLSTETLKNIAEDVLRQTARGSYSGSELIARTLAEEQLRLLATEGKAGDLSDLAEGLRKMNLLKRFSLKHHRGDRKFFGVAEFVMIYYAFSPAYELIAFTDKLDEFVETCAGHYLPGTMDDFKLDYSEFRKLLKNLCNDQFPQHEDVSEEELESNKMFATMQAVEFVLTNGSMARSAKGDGLCPTKIGYAGNLMNLTTHPLTRVFVSNPFVFKLMMDDQSTFPDETRILQKRVVHSFLGTEEAEKTEEQQPAFFNKSKTKWIIPAKLMREVFTLFKKKSS